MREDGPQLISDMIRKTLNIDCCVLMGANIAKVGQGRRPCICLCLTSDEGVTAAAAWSVPDPRPMQSRAAVEFVSSHRGGHRPRDPSPNNARRTSVVRS